LPPPRKRGRPRKKRAVEAPTATGMVLGCKRKATSMVLTDGAWLVDYAVLLEKAAADKAAAEQAAVEQAAAGQAAAEEAAAVIAEAAAEAAIEQAAAKLVAAEIEAAIEVEAQKAAERAVAEQVATERAAAKTAAAEKRLVREGMAPDRGFVDEASRPAARILDDGMEDICCICLLECPNAYMPCCRHHVHSACIKIWHGMGQDKTGKHAVKTPKQGGGPTKWKPEAMERLHECPLCGAALPSARVPSLP
jgi:hypothetical protein